MDPINKFDNDNSYPQQAENSTPKRVELLGTEKKTIYSSFNNQKYDLYISFPRSYWAKGNNRRYPVLYVLNAQWDFPMLVSSFGNQNYDGLIPEIILVGITWSGGEDVDIDFVDMGMRDFTPVQIEGTNYGGASKFLSAIKHDIIPFITKAYPVSEDRGLASASISGLFAVFTMLKEPKLFCKYIISSPAVHLQNGIIQQFETFFSTIHKTLNVNLFICYGELEDSKHIKKFISQFKERNYEGLIMETAEVKSTGHAGNKPMAFNYGLLSVYKRKSIDIQSKQLTKYCGIYQSFETTVEIIVASSGLALKFPEKAEEYPLCAETEYIFYIKGRYTFLTFNEEKNKIFLDIELWDKIFHTIKIV